MQQSFANLVAKNSAVECYTDHSWPFNAMKHGKYELPHTGFLKLLFDLRVLVMSKESWPLRFWKFEPARAFTME